MDNPKLTSIIIRTYNRPGLLARAIESVYSQTYSPIEIVVVNDNGADVLDVIDHFKNLPPQRKIVRKIEYVVNRSRIFRASSANVGLEMAKGQYIGFLDDDDILYSHHVSTHIAAQVKHKALLSISKAVESIETDRKLQGQFTEKEKLYFFPDKINKLNFFFFDNYFPSNSVIFQKKVLEKVGKFDPNLFVLEDWDFFIRLLLRYEPLLINDVTCIYTTRGSKFNIRYSDKHRDSWKKSFRYIKDKYRTVYKDSEVSIPISEVSEFLTEYAKEWYDFYKDYEVLYNSKMFKIFRKLRKAYYWVFKLRKNYLKES